MKGFVTALAIFPVAILQVTLAPLFPFVLAQADFALLFVTLIAILRGGQVAMWVVPVIAIFVSFLSDRTPAASLAGYALVLPLLSLFYSSESNIALGVFVRAGAVLAIAGVVTRVLYAIAAFAGGAEPEIGVLITKILLPGILLDLALLAVAYGCCRALGWKPRSTSLSRGGLRAYGGI